MSKKVNNQMDALEEKLDSEIVAMKGTLETSLSFVKGEIGELSALVKQLLLTKDKPLPTATPAMTNAREDDWADIGSVNSDERGVGRRGAPMENRLGASPGCNFATHGAQKKVGGEPRASANPIGAGSLHSRARSLGIRADSWIRKLNMPIFEGDDLLVFRVERYFFVHQLTKEEKLATTAIYLEGKALLWY